MEDGEVKNFINVWLAAIASLCYCYFVSRRLPKGFVRLLSLLPIISLFALLPLSLSSFHLCGATAFMLTALANFRLLLLAFGLGPLSSSSSPDLPLLHFLAVAPLPIDPSSPKTTPSSPNPRTSPSPPPPSSLSRFALKPLLLAAVLRAYEYGPQMHPHVISVLNACHLYLGAELGLALIAGLVRAGLGLECGPAFRDPYLSTSLQDFWGRRWNLVVSSVLRSAVHGPVRRALTPSMGRLWARVMGTMAAFLVSGLMHELIFFYLMRVVPTWEVTWFFVLHGAGTAAEAAVGRMAAAAGWGLRLPRVVSSVLVMGFVAVTGALIFLPPTKRSGLDRKAVEEYSIGLDFVKANFPFRSPSFS